MIPVFSNVVSVTKNSTNSEVVLDFRHIYPDSVVDNDGKVLIVQKNEPVFSTIITYDNAKALRELLDNILK